jgi:hypothetical protein
MKENTTKEKTMTTIGFVCMGLVKATLLWALFNPQTQFSTPPVQPQTQTQPCVPAAAPPKKSTFADRIKLRLEQRLEMMAQQEVNKIGGKVGKATGGVLDGSALPTVPEIVGSVPTQPKPCIAVPAASSPLGQPTTAPVTPASPAPVPQH